MHNTGLAELANLAQSWVRLPRGMSGKPRGSVAPLPSIYALAREGWSPRWQIAIWYPRRCGALDIAATPLQTRAFRAT